MAEVNPVADGSVAGRGRDLEIIACPECGAPAEIVWSNFLSSTDGPIEHIDVRCIQRHGFFMPRDRAA